MSVVAGCQEVISGPSALCKQTLLMHAMERGSYFGDRFRTPGKQDLITCLIYGAYAEPAAATAGPPSPPPQRTQLSDAEVFISSFTHSYDKAPISAGSYFRAVLFLFLKSIEKAPNVTEQQLRISITEFHEA